MTNHTYSIDKNLTIGLEIEFSNRTTSGRQIQERVGRKIVELTGWSPDYSYRRITDNQGRMWKIVDDGSVTTGGELVAPVLRLADLEENGSLHTVIKAMRKAGATPCNSAGIHVHVGLTNAIGETMTPKQVVNAMSITHNLGNFLHVVSDRRNSDAARWAPQVPTTMVEAMKKFGKNVTMDNIGSVFYAYSNGQANCGGRGNINQGWRSNCSYHYSSARYLACNLHNLWYRSGNARTIEFRLFSTMNHKQANGRMGFHFGKIKAYIHLCLGIISKAKRTSRTTLRRKEIRENESRYQFRVACIHLGLIGDEYKTTRKHLMNHFGGTYRGERRTPAQTQRTAERAQFYWATDVNVQEAA